MDMLAQISPLDELETTKDELAGRMTKQPVAGHSSSTLETFAAYRKALWRVARSLPGRQTGGNEFRSQ